MLLHLLDVFADAGLRQMHQFGGAGKAARFGHRLEDS